MAPISSSSESSSHSDRHKRKRRSRDDRRDEDRKRHRKRKSKKEHKRSRRYDDSDSGEDDYEESRRHRRKHKKHKKDRKRKSRDYSDDERSKDRTHKKEPSHKPHTHSIHHGLLQALSKLFSARPVFAQELPIIMIRLASGSTLDFRQMDDEVTAEMLHQVFQGLQPLTGAAIGGKLEFDNGVWSFPCDLPSLSSNSQKPSRHPDERVLLRVLRSVLDEVGVTMQAVSHFEKERSKAMAEATKPTSATLDETEQELLDRIRDLTSRMILQFQSNDPNLGLHLAQLCQDTLAKGESLSIDSLPDESLKSALQRIFETCGLERAEMADDGKQSDQENSKLMGFAIPADMASNSTRFDKVSRRLAAIMESCRNPQKRALGPARPTLQQQTMAQEEEDGPLLPDEAAARKARGPAIPLHVLRAQAEQRELELRATMAGVEVPTQGAGGREEWMIVPGKFDFMSQVKAGQTKSRGFQNKKTRGGDQKNHEDEPIHPAIQAEMDAIRKAHLEARGPSLMEQHQINKREEKKAETKEGGWNWSRDKDLDAGRRVDKNALNTVLGGAADNLKTKFHGGFN
eukprot:Nitzschia sp. Nitz4//scaffold17_size182527//96777//98492//NITZ4_001858-RA/size182527-processed-gene-0.56-mRNA-1//-1//CDS//3329539352//1529//frame0